MPSTQPYDLDPLWYKDAVIYELHIKAFQDGNADGIGDFKGLIERLDYLQDLGVTAIWLLPFYPSPQRDGGYDISDYFSIHPAYGALRDFRKLMRLAHERGLKVITELVINHTSDQHPWFQRARQSPPGSRYRNYYVWSQTPEKYQDVRIIFQDFETSNWSWDPVAQAYYWHRFYAHQPDLNFDSGDVRREIFRILDFWMDIGVDGFRLDAIPYLYEREGTNCENLPETHAFLRELRAHVDSRRPGVLLLAEANMWPEDSASYFGQGDECHMNFHFPIMPRMFLSLKMEDRRPLIDIIHQTPPIPDNCQWAIFLRNHDELTLEMVTEEERDFMYRAYNKDAASRINLGIRHRLAPLLDNHRQKIELMNILLFSMPGTPVIYYGDEIGMGDNIHLGDRDGVRTPMQWSPDRNAGFSSAHPQRLYLPLIQDPEYEFTTVNVEIQQNNSSSLLWWMKRTIAIRKRYQAFGRGDIHFLQPENGKVIAFTRSYGEEHLLVLANLSRYPQVVELELPGFEQFSPVEVFGKTAFPRLERGPNRFTLGPYGYFWFALKPQAGWSPGEAEPVEIDWEPGRWMDLLQGRNLHQLTDSILPSFFARNNAYIRDSRMVDHLEIVHAQPFSFNESGSAALLIVQAQLTEGVKEWYFLAIMAKEGDPREQVDAPAAESILALLKKGQRKAFLFEAVTDSGFQQFLLHQLLYGQQLASGGFRIFRSPVLSAPPADLPVGRVLKGRGGNLSISYGDQFFLKLYLRLHKAPNPDVEINLQAQRKALPVAGYLGKIQLERADLEPLALGLLQPFIPSQGSAWQYFFDGARLYLEQVQADSGDVPDDLLLTRAGLLGQTLAQLHAGLLDPNHPDFSPETYSLHYQRSLYSGFQSLLRATIKLLERQERKPVDLEDLQPLEEELSSQFRQIYHHLIPAPKLRIHGDLHLEKVLFTGRTFYFYHFEGSRYQPFSELRLKKSSLRDLASLICSLHYVSLSAMAATSESRNVPNGSLLPATETFFDEVAQSLQTEYLREARSAGGLLPHKESDTELMLHLFILERHLQEVRHEIESGRGWTDIPMRGLLRKLGNSQSAVSFPGK